MRTWSSPCPLQLYYGHPASHPPHNALPSKWPHHRELLSVSLAPPASALIHLSQVQQMCFHFLLICLLFSGSSLPVAQIDSQFSPTFTLPSRAILGGQRPLLTSLIRELLSPVLRGSQLSSLPPLRPHPHQPTQSPLRPHTLSDPHSHLSGHTSLSQAATLLSGCCRSKQPFQS